MTTVGPHQPEPPREPAQETAQSAQETAQSAQETAQSAQETAQSAQTSAQSDSPKETPPTEESKETPPTEQSKETPPTEQSKETPPTADSPETPPSADSSETPPTEESTEEKEDSSDEGPIKARFGPAAPEPRVVLSEEERAASEHLERATHNERTGGGEVREGELQEAREEHLRRTAGIGS